MIARLLALASGAVCLATLLAYGGRWSWFCELLVNFRAHFALLLILACVLAIAFRHWRIAGVAAAGIALNVWPMYGAFVGTGAPPVSNARAVRVAAFNVHITNDNLPGIATHLESQAVDVAVLEELTPANADQLAALLPQLSHRYLAQNQDIWGVVILSRWPLIAPQPATRDGLLFAARADVDLGDRKLRLYGVHLHWPVVPAAARVRNAQLQALGRELSECTHACVVVGDFNVTPWSSHFRDLLKSRAVHDCAAGRGLLGTWFSGLPAVLRIRIDQCLVAGAVSVADVRVGESVGSDHFATINDLLIGGP
ncbi:MAG TPA: endonuclease/exonuclease/phosphatase family protein [Steroidobacteraceae bacterium]|nr:endonuclease/exonuclease/phosphatase family protein [Steroidobacteraceae bacterium]